MYALMNQKILLCIWNLLHNLIYYKEDLINEKLYNNTKWNQQYLRIEHVKMIYLIFYMNNC